MFVQDNISYSNLGVLRGLHYQLEPKAQGKLIKVLKGEIYDVVVDLRKSSSTFLSWFGIELSQKNNKQLWIPKGFAHGFSCFGKENIVIYSCTNYRNASGERGILWNDKTLKINWKIKKPIVSVKDKNNPEFKDLF